MSLVERLQAVAERAASVGDTLKTEEATKNALVMPFIQAIGYDVFNPLEVVPEFTADVGTKKGEKVDYAIKLDGRVAILIECKRFGTNLRDAEFSQLYRYFGVSDARIAILTNGLQYRLFSDLDDSNKMDARPFLELDLGNIRDQQVRDIEKLTKQSFDMDGVLNAAGNLKALRGIRLALSELLEGDSEEFARLVFRVVYPDDIFTKARKEWFSPLVVRGVRSLVQERVEARLKQALQTNDTPEPSPESDTVATETLAPAPDDGIVTTDEELAGFRIVQAIACSALPVDRITYRDAKSYFAVLADDNNRKPICRLWFNTSQWYVGLLDENKNETRHPIESVRDIYDHADAIRAAAARWSD